MQRHPTTNDDSKTRRLIDRHTQVSCMQPKWKLILITSSVAGFCGFLTIVFAAYSLFRGETYRESLAAVKSHPEVIEALGTPMEPSLLFSPNYFFSGFMLQYQVTGPRASAMVYMLASKEEDVWALESVWILPDGASETISVLEPEPVSSSGSCNSLINDYEMPDYPTEESEQISDS